MISNGRNTVCGIDWQGNIWCWGTHASMPKFRDSQIYRLDDGWNAAATRLNAPGWDRFILVDLALLTGCALTKKGRVFCWEYEHKDLKEMKPLKGARKITIGPDHVCALLPKNNIICIDDISKALEIEDQDPNAVPIREIDIPR